MALLHEARSKIQEARAKEEELRRLDLESQTRQYQEDQQRLQEEKSKLSSQLRSACEQLLINHGSIIPETNYKGIGRIRFLWDNPGRILETSVANSSEEEPVKVRIASLLNLNKSSITIDIQGIDTHLDLPKSGDPLKKYGILGGESASNVDLTDYKEVIDLVKQNLEPPAA